MIKGIVAISRDWAIGKNNGLLFSIKEDMQFFKYKTEHHIVVMGYNTYLSLPEKFRPLPNRVNLVLWDKAPSSDCLENCITFNDFGNLVNFVKILAKEYDVFICGGASVYKLFLPYYDEVFVTKVDASDSEATAFFPNLDNETSYYIDRELGSGTDNNLNYTFVSYKRKQG